MTPPAASTSTLELVKYQKGLRTQILASSHFNDDPSIKTTFDAWSKGTDSLESIHVQIAAILPQLVALRGQEGSARTTFLLDASLFLTTLRVVFGTDLAAFGSMGLHAGGTPTVAPPITAPRDLRVTPVKGQPTHHVVRWHRVAGAALYDVERCADPPVEAGYTTVYSDKRAKLADSGALGQVVWYRVRARGNGTSGWSSPISYVIR